MSPHKLIGVIGSRDCDETIYSLAYDVGKKLAEKGFGLICGGLGGVMEAACKGAADAGGLTVGVLPGESPESANPYVGVRVATGMGVARNVIIVRSATAVVAISGGPGTLSEIAYCLQLGVPVVGLQTHDVSEKIVKVTTADQAVKEIVSRTGTKR